MVQTRLRFCTLAASLSPCQYPSMQCNATQVTSGICCPKPKSQKEEVPLSPGIPHRYTIEKGAYQ